MFARNFYRHGLLGRFIGFSHFLVRLLGGNLSRLGAAESAEDRHALFDRHLAPVFRNPLVRFLANRPTALYSLGIPPAQFDAIRKDAKEGIAADFSDRMRRLTCDWPLEENCFAMQAVKRRYDIACQRSLPMYLQSQHYDAIRGNLDRLQAHHTTLTAFLEGQAAESLDAYVFLDAQDWMDREQLTALWLEVARTARPGARVVFRSGGASSPLESKLPPELISRWKTDPLRNRELHALDRSAIYGGMHLYQKLG
jgi:S-adenosylmethionine-diacylglycerol 3-amino-3-carboxypropyl transferase